MSRSCQSGDVLEPDLGSGADDPCQAADALGDDRVALVRHRRRALLAGARTAPAPRAPRCGRGAGSRPRTARARWRGGRARRGAPRGGRAGSTWVETGSGSRPRRSQAIRSTSGSVAAYVPTAPESLPDPHALERPAQAPPAADELGRPAGQLQAEGRRLGVDAVGAPHAEGRAVLLGAARRPRPSARSTPSRSRAPASRSWSASAVSTTSEEVSP